MRTALLVLALVTPALAQAGDAPAEEVISQLLQERVTIGFEETPLGTALDMIQDAVWLNVVVSPDAEAEKTLSLPSAERSVGELVAAIEAAHDLEHQVYCDVLYLHPRGAPPLATPREPVPSALPGYTFRFRGEPLHDALQLVLELAGLKLVVPPPLAAELAQPVSLRARNLPLHHALTLITGRAGLSWSFDGESIRLRRPPAPGERVQALQDRLERPLTLELTDEPLPQVLDSLAGAADVEIRVSGELPGTPTTLRLDATPLRAALDQLCEQAGLSWAREDGVVVVSPLGRE